MIHLALAPKSNSVIAALGAATTAVRDRRPGPVPMHLRDAHYRGAQMLGHGKGYVYPHDDPSGWVPQEHLPVEVAGERFYRASGHGAERRLIEQWRKRRGEDAGDDVGVTMSTGDVLAVVAATVVDRCSSPCSRPCSSLLTRTLRATARHGRRRSRPTRSRCSTTRAPRCEDAATEIDRVERLVTSAERLDEAKRAIATPVVKAMAFGTGVSRAAQRLRDGESPRPVGSKRRRSAS